MHVDLESIIDCLDNKKDAFISKCRQDIESDVTSRGRGSLAIREVGVRTHYAAPDSYLKVLWKFRKGELYHGHRLESVLSEPISALVVKNYNGFLEDHKPDIEAQLKQQIADSIDISSLLEKILYEELRKQGVKQVRHQAASAFVNGCESAFHTQLAQTTGGAVSHAVSTTVGTTVGASIAHALSVAIAHAIATAMVHLAHSVAFKAVLKAIIVHSVGAIVTAVLVKMIAAHMTAASAGALLGPIVWVAGGTYVLIKILTIPDTLGEELGEALADDMRGKFRPWTEKALEACFEKMADPEELLKSVVKGEIDTFLPDVLGEMADVQSEPHAYEEVQKDVKKLVGYGEKGAKKLEKKWKFFFW
ncbi:MAG: hypothetical protein HETSPECPRED_001547 [Heterodermia speciosa]|uniref:Uncharacterized protein n=1 Tax=Heterodermia speciosa TaxID=116794 RepID=A0A8H3J241_9LECA|nr:MAG: hypothetical protein HETSPECPRED_001547 [Heterodermia speciosa]